MADAGDLFRCDDAQGVVDLGELVGADVVLVDELLLAISPLEFPRTRLDTFGVESVVTAIEEPVVLVGVEVFSDDNEVLLLPWGVVLFLLLLLLSDLPFLVLLLVRFSAIRSFRTHSSYLK